jgi:hypothetical protein
MGVVCFTFVLFQIVFMYFGISKESVDGDVSGKSIYVSPYCRLSSNIPMMYFIILAADSWFQ